MEGHNLIFVEDLSVRNDFWHMKARVIRMWEQTFKYDMILIDERGKKIQANVKRSLMPGFQQYLKEDAIIVIRKFGVGEQKDKYKVVPLNHKINFFKCTSVQPVTSFSGDLYGFDLVSFLDILQNWVRQRPTVDILGKIAWCGDLDIFKSSDKESRRVNFELQDIE